MKLRFWPTIAVLFLAAVLGMFGLVGWQAWQDYRETEARIQRWLEEWEKLDPRLDELEQRVDNWERLASTIDAHKPDVPAQALAGQIVASAKRWAGDGWSELLWYVVAIGAVETGWKTRAVGRLGERGPLQVLPSTARAMGVRNLGDWRETLDAGVRYFIRVALPRAGGDMPTAVAHYNAGPTRSGRVVRAIASRYVSRVMAAKGRVGE